MELLILTGMSGSGKSKALEALEDIGYYCLDNLPVQLIPNIATTISNIEGIVDKIAVLVDVRSNLNFEDFSKVIDELEEKDIKYKILFIDCKNEIILNRYKETRRLHPLKMFDPNLSLIECIDKEKVNLNKILSMADYVIDTTNLTPTLLKLRVKQYFDYSNKSDMIINFVSFGFKNGILREADLVYDVRCLPNPFYIPQLKNKTGLDQEVRDYVMSSDDAKKIFNNICEYLNLTIPLYIQEGKSQLVIGLGCTGGKHRSVTFAKLLNEHFKNNHLTIERHRDLGKE